MCLCTCAYTPIHVTHTHDPSPVLITFHLICLCCENKHILRSPRQSHGGWTIISSCPMLGKWQPCGAPLRVDCKAEPVTCLPFSGGQTLTLLVSYTDDESPGLYGFLNVIVHSATGFKQSSSKCLDWGGRQQGTEPEGVGNQGSGSNYHQASLTSDLWRCWCWTWCWVWSCFPGVDSALSHTCLQSFELVS